MSKRNTIRLEQEKIILDLLRDNQYTIKALEEKTGMNYYTVRAIINSLFQKRKVDIVATMDRHRVYGLSVGSHVNDRIPYIANIISRQRHKAVGLLEAVGNEDSMQAVRAVKEIPELLTLLLDLANDASHGFDVNTRLDSIRDRMQRNYLILKNAASIYEQILEDGYFWNPGYLKTMVDDPDYNYSEIQKAVQYYGRNNPPS